MKDPWKGLGNVFDCRFDDDEIAAQREPGVTISDSSSSRNNATFDPLAERHSIRDLGRARPFIVYASKDYMTVISP